MSHTTTMEYGRKLVHAGVTGLRAGRKNFDPDKAIALVGRSAVESLQLALAGACLGVIPAWLLTRRSRSTNLLLVAGIGGVVGFAAGFSWKTRELSATLAHSAMDDMGRVKDEHWLERHPIDYA